MIPEDELKFYSLIEDSRNPYLTVDLDPNVPKTIFDAYMQILPSTMFYSTMN